MFNKIGLVIALACTLCLQSCYVNYHSVSGGPEGKRKKGDGTVEYSNGKQHYVLWGLVRIGEPKAKVPEGAYEIKTSNNVWGYVCSALTGGIYTFRKVRYYTNTGGKAEETEIQRREETVLD